MRCLPALLLVLLCASPLQSAESPEELYRYARGLMLNRRDYAAAAEKFARFTKQHPDHDDAAQALSYEGLCRSRLGEFKQAAGVYRSLLEAYPNASEKLRSEAMAYGGDAAFQAGDFATAAGLYRQLLEAFPQSPLVPNARFWYAESCYRIAEAARERKDEGKTAEWFTKAQEHFLHLADADPPGAHATDALYNAAYAAFERKDTDAAVRLFDRFATKHADDKRRGEALLLKGEALLRARRYDDAFAAFGADPLAKGDPELRGKALIGQAWCRYESDRPADAGTLFAAAAAAADALDNKHAATLRYRAGKAFLEAGQPDQARKHLDAASSVTPHPLHGEILLRRAEARLLHLRQANPDAASATRERDRAIATLREAQQAGGLVRSDEADLQALLAEALLEHGAYAEAAAIFGTFAGQYHRDPRVPWAVYNQAFALHKADRSAEALKAARLLFENAKDAPLRLDAAWAMADYAEAAGAPGAADQALAWLADEGLPWAEATAPKLAQAERAPLLQTARRLAPQALLRLANRLMDTGDPKGAEARWRQLATRFPNHETAADAWIQVGILAEARNDLPAAVEAYAKAAEADPPEVRASALVRMGAAKVLQGQAAPDATEREALLRSALDHLQAPDARKATGPLAAMQAYYGAEALYALGRTKEALPFYEAARAANPPADLQDAVLFGLGWCRHDLGQLDAAAEAFEALVKEHPESPFRPEAMAVLGRIQLATDAPRAAVKTLTALRQAHPDLPLATAARVDLAAAHRALGVAAEARGELEAFLARHPDHADAPRARFVYAMLLWDHIEPLLADAAEARKALAALRRQTGDAPATEDEDPSPATTEARKALDAATAAVRAALPPLRKALAACLADDPPAVRRAHLQLRRGELLLFEEDYAGALPAYTAAAGAQSEVADRAAYRLGWCHLHLAGTATGADAEPHRAAPRKAFARVATEHPHSPLAAESAFRAAEILRETGAHEDAAALYAKALDADGGLSGALQAAAVYGRALSLIALGRHGDAAAVCQAWLDAPTAETFAPEIHWAAGEAAFLSGADADAADHYRAAKADHYAGEAAAKAQFGLGRIALRAEQLQEARDAFLKVDLFYPQWPAWAARALQEAASIADRLDRPDDARKDRERIRTVYPKTDAARALDAADRPAAPDITPAPASEEPN